MRFLYHLLMAVLATALLYVASTAFNYIDVLYRAFVP
jgi:hypothetical protein